MFAWLKRRSWERQQLIYSFFDGQQARKVDPLAVWFALRTDPELLLDQHLTLLEDAPEEEPAMLQNGRVEAWQMAGRAVGRAFGLPDGKLNLWARRQLLLEFCIYLHTLKKNISALPICLPPTVRQCLDRLTTKHGSASTSTGHALKPGEPAELHLA